MLLALRPLRKLVLEIALRIRHQSIVLQRSLRGVQVYPMRRFYERVSRINTVCHRGVTSVPVARGLNFVRLIMWAAYRPP